MLAGDKEMKGKVFAWGGLALLLLWALAGDGYGQQTGISCGSTITRDFTLARDLKCDKDGIIIGRDGIVLDLGGHTITGPGKGGWVWPGRATSSVGVRLAGRSGVTVKNGRLTGFATGVLLEGGENNRVERVATTQNHYGVYLYRSKGNRVSGVEVFANVYGLHLQGSDGNQLVSSRMYRNGHSPGGYGITLYSSSDNLVRENTVEHNQTVGIWIINSRGNLIYRNNLIKNSPNAVDESGGNRWYEPKLKQGNYWSDYRGKASAGYPLGGPPYRLGGFGGAYDRYPFVKRNGWQPR